MNFLSRILRRLVASPTAGDARHPAVTIGHKKKAKTKGPGFDYQRPFLSYRDLPKVAKRKAAAYRAAEPFPHTVLDDLFERDIVRRVAREVREMDVSAFHGTDNRHEVKLSTEDDAQLGPATWKLVHALNSGAFVAFLEVLTGINGLIADPHLRGGGVHVVRRGGKLGVHADFNYYERLKVYRRLNLLLYLNRGWNEEWGGQLELWNRDKTRCCRHIAPIFNRTVIFDTSNFSYHGHPNPLDCPEREMRKSLALYYYTVDYPYETDLAPHSTLFVEARRDTTGS